MFSLLGIAAAATTTALGAFSEGVITSAIICSIAKNTGKGSLVLKK